ncbi:MAG: toxic anion resistance protein, partial [Clostridia bacterium]|nr:toxic anion resistance protein [Clostridia bacterium]
MENKTPEFKLTLDPFGTQATKEAEKAAVELEVVEAKAEELAAMTEANLTPEEKQMVEDFAKTIDITDSAQVMQYGAGTQQKVADFSDGALKAVRTRDLGEVGDDLSKLVGELKSFNSDADDKGFLSFFRGAKKKVAVLKARYDKVEVSVNDIVNVLEGHQVTLMKDVAVLDQLYGANLDYFKELSMYIIAGKKKLEEEKNTTLPALRKKAEESGLPEDAQAANDYAALCDRFEKRIYDLELTRMVSIQMAPQIRLVQGNDSRMSEKIQSTVVNTIPLWKSQMLLSLGLAHSEEALKAERAVTDMTNDLLKKNAEKLHQST